MSNEHLYNRRHLSSPNSFSKLNDKQHALCHATTVTLPYPIYDSQRQIMSAIHECIVKKENAAIHCPTGTGKTIAMISAAIGTVRALNTQHACTPSFTCAMDPSDELANIINTQDKLSSSNSTACSSQASDTTNNEDIAYKTPHIFIATRTHSQIKHIVEEIRRSEFANDINLTVLSSRKHCCLNPEVLAAFDINSACKNITQKWNDNITTNHSNNGAERICMFHGHDFRDKLNAIYRKTATHPLNNVPSGTQNVFPNSPEGIFNVMRSPSLTFPLPAIPDIEDMQIFGLSETICPFHLSRAMHKAASIVICPYNFILTPEVRKTTNVNLRNSVIIFDEAHNIASVGRASLSSLFNTNLLNQCIDILTVIETHLSPARAESRNCLQNLIMLFDNLGNAAWNKVIYAFDTESKRINATANGQQCKAATYMHDDILEFFINDVGFDLDEINGLTTIFTNIVDEILNPETIAMIENKHSQSSGEIKYNCFKILDAVCQVVLQAHEMAIFITFQQQQLHR